MSPRGRKSFKAVLKYSFFHSNIYWAFVNAIHALGQEPAIFFSLKGQIVNVSGFVNHMQSLSLIKKKKKRVSSSTHSPSDSLQIFKNIKHILSSPCPKADHGPVSL